MFEIVTSTKFLKDLKLLKKGSGKDFGLLQQLITILAEKGHKGLHKNNKPHKLSGNYKGYFPVPAGSLAEDPAQRACLNQKMLYLRCGYPNQTSNNRQYMVCHLHLL